MIKRRLETAASRQKSYADPKRRDVEFQVGDYVFLKVSSMKSVLRFGKKGKLAPRYIGPFEILERIGMIAHRLALPSNMSQGHTDERCDEVWQEGRVSTEIHQTF